MKRFLLGTAAGISSGILVNAFVDDPRISAAVGAGVAFAVWMWRLILRGLDAPVDIGVDIFN